MRVHMICYLVTLATVISCSFQQTASSPLEVPAVISAVNGTCLTAAERDAIHQNTQEQVMSLLEQVSLSDPPCACGRPGDWTRIAFLNMTDPTQQCPSNWRLISSPVRGCGRGTTAGAACDSATFPSGGKSYSRVCGRVIAYQRGTSDAFDPSIRGGRGQIENIYIDGISLTHGNAGSRQHIWSFVGAIGERNTDVQNFICPCTSTNIAWPFQVPSFIGNNYFCDTGNRGPGFTFGTIYVDDPLWDGEGCGPNSSCCEFNNPPWFCTTLPQATTDDMELRHWS